MALNSSVVPSAVPAQCRHREHPQEEGGLVTDRVDHGFLQRLCQCQSSLLQLRVGIG